MRNNDTMNTLYYGDCLTIMENMMEAGSVDLIYHDPPFNSSEITTRYIKTRRVGHYRTR